MSKNRDSIMSTVSTPVKTPEKGAVTPVKRLFTSRMEPDHPTYAVMVAAAIASLKDRRGSSRQAIVKHIMANYDVGDETTRINARVKMVLRSGVKAGTLKQARGTGAAGSFRLGEKKRDAKAKGPAAKTKKAVSKSPAKTKKAVSKPPAKTKKAGFKPPAANTKKAVSKHPAKTKKTASKSPAKTKPKTVSKSLAKTKKAESQKATVAAKPDKSKATKTATQKVAKSPTKTKKAAQPKKTRTTTKMAAK